MMTSSMARVDEPTEADLRTFDEWGLPEDDRQQIISTLGVIVRINAKVYLLLVLILLFLILLNKYIYVSVFVYALIQHLFDM